MTYWYEINWLENVENVLTGFKKNPQKLNDLFGCLIFLILFIYFLH